MLPKYARAQREILNLIASQGLAVGSLLPTEKELAVQLDVSIITIRRAMQELVERGLVRREQGRGTFVTADIQQQEALGRMAFLNITQEDLLYPTVGAAPSKLSESVAKRGYRLELLFAGPEVRASLVEPLTTMDGVIATGYVTPEWVQFLKGLSIPVVFMGDILGSPQGIPVVAYHWRKMTAMLTTAFCEQGAQNIGLITASDDYAPALQMRDGLKQELKRQGRTFRPENVYFAHGIIYESVPAFLEAHPDVDAWLVEAGCYTHVIGSLLKRRKRPALGVLSVWRQFRPALDNYMEAVFRGSIYEQTVELLFAMAQEQRTRQPNVYLQPCLVEV